MKNIFKKVLLFSFATASLAFYACKDDEDDTVVVKDSVSKETGSSNSHGYVDLGLPSGTKWATCNIGAGSPQDFGYFCSWGEIDPAVREAKDDSIEVCNERIRAIEAEYADKLAEAIKAENEALAAAKTKLETAEGKEEKESLKKEISDLENTIKTKTKENKTACESAVSPVKDEKAAIEKRKKVAEQSLKITVRATRDSIDLMKNNELASKYDVATALWGGSWRMPSEKQFDELISNCKYGWKVVKNVQGMMFEGPNGKTIFLPAAGCKDPNSTVTDADGRSSLFCGMYWGRTNGRTNDEVKDDSVKVRTVTNLYFTKQYTDGAAGVGELGCNLRLSVRPVVSKK